MAAGTGVGETSSQGTTPELSVVVVTYRTRELVLRCVESVYADAPAGLGLQVIVVDNASEDGTVEALAASYPQARVIANHENLGPAKAYNQGVTAALGMGSTYILMLNSDIEVLPGVIGPMLAYLKAHPRVSGVVGGLYNPDGSRQRMRVQITQWRKPAWEKEFRATFVSTCFLMAQRGAFEAVGFFDEAYYFHNEDLDWSERATRLGLEFHYLPGVKVMHHCSVGKRQNYGPIVAELYPSNLYYFHKFYGPVIARLARWGMSLELAATMRQLRKNLAATTDPAERRRLEDSLAYLAEGRRRMMAMAVSGNLPERWQASRAGNGRRKGN